MKCISVLLRAGSLALVFAMNPSAAALAGTVEQQQTSNRLRLAQSTYSEFNKYEDNGTLQITYYENEEPVQSSLINFSTRFVRSGNFEIRWRKTMRGRDGLPYKIWTSEGIALSQYGLDAPFKSSSLYDALSRAVGISNSITIYAPCFLMPSMECSACDRATEVTTNHENSANSNLERIDVKYASGNLESFWIDKENNQVKRIEWWNKKNNLNVHHQITYTEISAE